MNNFNAGTLECLTLENQHIKACVLPELGGKISSLTHKAAHFEAAAQTSKTHKKAAFGSVFAEFDASGLDDCFPTIHQCRHPITGKVYPDHGEIWSAGFECSAQNGGLTLTYDSLNFGYTYRKDIFLQGSSLEINYNISNNCSVPLACIWAFHGLMRYEPDMYFELPAGTTEFIDVLNGNAPFSSRDFACHKPLENKAKGMVKYYAAQAVKNGCCGIVYPSSKMKLTLEYDHNILPYLGFWITSGGFRGDYNCALEPCNGFYDDIVTAGENNSLYYLTGEKPLAFSLKITLSPL